MKATTCLMPFPSRNTDHPYHSTRLMFENVAVEHPVARIVCDENDLDPLARGHQHRVLPFAMHSGLPVPAKNPKGMAVHVDRVEDMARRSDAVDKPNIVALHHAHSVVPAHRVAFTGNPHLTHGQPTHHAAGKGDFVATDVGRVRFGDRIDRKF